MSLIKLTCDEFEVQFKPVENFEHDQGVFQFDANDENDSNFLQFMSNNHPNHIWTRIDGEDGYIYNINGWHIVDRIDYVITEIPWLNCHDEYKKNKRPFPENQRLY